MKRTKAKPKAKPKTAYAQGVLSVDDKAWIRGELAAWHVKLVEQIEQMIVVSKSEAMQSVDETKLPPVPYET
jgi:hypothetical protein